jgi:protein-tyrosine phosphatase
MPDRAISDAKNQLRSRHLNWQQCYNTRDLGGLPTKRGKETCWQAVIRSDNLSRLTEQGQQALLDYGVRTIIDLRPPQEVAKWPSAVIESRDHPVAYLNLPIEKYYPHVSALITQAKSRGEVYCIILDHYPDLFVEIMRAIAKAQPGGIVVHCHAGKDRTGIVSALLLGFVGVPADIIAADYAESQVRLQSLEPKTISGIEDGEGRDFWQQPTATKEMMVLMLEHIDKHYGGAEKYLQASGLSSADADQLKSRLIGP